MNDYIKETIYNDERNDIIKYVKRCPDCKDLFADLDYVVICMDCKLKPELDNEKS